MRIAILRRFSIRDAMILIAATGVGIAAVQAMLGQMRATQIGLDTWSIWPILASPLVGMWCLAIAAASLSRGGVRRQRRFRMPGVTAAYTTWIVFLGGNWPFVRLNPGILVAPNPGAILILWDQAAHFAGLSILAVWATQALAGCWRPTPTWIDRAGRLAGLFWIASYILTGLNI